MGLRALNVPVFVAAAVAGGVIAPVAMAVDEYRRDSTGAVGHTNLVYTLSGPARPVRLGFFNNYDVLPGLETITGVTIGWGSNSAAQPPNPNRDGTPFVAGIWDDLDNNPATADWVLVSSSNAVIMGSQSDDLMTIDVPDVTVSGLFYVGAYLDVPMVTGINNVDNLIAVDIFLGGGQMRTVTDIADAGNPLAGAGGVSIGPRWGFLRASAVPGPGGLALVAVAAGWAGVRRGRRERPGSAASVSRGLAFTASPRMNAL